MVPAFTDLAQVFMKRLGRSTLRGQPWMMPFEAASVLSHMACHDKPSSQLAVHATQRLHDAKFLCLASEPAGRQFLAEHCQNKCSIPSTYPPNQSHQPVRIPRTARDPSTHLQHVFRACNHAARCQPIFPTSALCHDLLTRPTACTLKP